MEYIIDQVKERGVAKIVLDYKQHMEWGIDIIDKFDGNWEIISKQSDLPVNFLRAYMNMLDWDYISIYYDISDNFINEFHNKINWRNIIKNELITLSEKKYCNLSDECVREWGYSFFSQKHHVELCIAGRQAVINSEKNIFAGMTLIQIIQEKVNSFTCYEIAIFLQEMGELLQSTHIV